MDTHPNPPPEPAEQGDPLALGVAAASQLGGEWQFDTIEEAPQTEPTQETDKEDETPPSEPNEVSTRGADVPRSPGASPTLDLPPSPEQLIEAMLFVGGHPLTAEIACSAIRGLTTERFQAAVNVLNRRYREQWRPYAIESRDAGFVLTVRQTYRNLRERLFGSTRKTRLSQPALDVLSVVAYRQPVSKAEVDAIRGTDSGAVLRQLVRLGMVAVQHRAESGAREVRYGTTPRFLQVFGLSSLDELPRLGNAQQV